MLVSVTFSFADGIKIFRGITNTNNQDNITRYMHGRIWISQRGDRGEAWVRPG